MGVLIVLAGTLLAGCSPKRVVTTGAVVAESVSEPISEPVAESIAESTPESGRNAKSAPQSSFPAVTDPLPDPKPIAKSGAHSRVTGKSAPTALGPRAVELAKGQLGKPYQWGAAGPDKFDCSGLVQYVYSNLGVQLPRVSGQQAGAGVHVDRKDLQPGDLVFFRLSGSRIDHVGIYVGRGKFVHAPRKHSPVRFDSLNDAWWRRKFKGGRRVG